jgi:nucleotide-binding universal stress UspA family protein
MTAGDERRLVAVGVDGSLEATEAARYASAAAHTRGVDLLLVHAYQLPPRAGALTETAVESARRAAERVGTDVLSQVRIAPDQLVDSLVELTTAELLLLRVSRRAELVVLGKHSFDLADQLLTGPVMSTVAASSLCPVVVVPRGWSRARWPARAVAVALDGETSAGAALRFAFDEAELRRWPVVALHTLARPGQGARFGGEAVNIEELLAGQKEDHPDVEVSTVMTLGEPSPAIQRASATVGLLVLGRPHRHVGLRSWSHSVARSVLAGAQCPVVIVPPEPRVRARPDGVARGEHAQRQRSAVVHTSAR